jgi:alkylation response protein AidB-like acyl-CoA dehydrogenase
MDLSLTTEQIGFREEVREWMAREVRRPWIDEIRRPENDENRLVEVRREFQRRLNDAGYLGLDWPVEYGGRGRSPIYRVILQEELARADAPPLPNFIGLQMLAPALIHHGNDAQRRRFIPRILSADEIWCQGFSEPDAGSDLASLRTRAEPDGADYRLTGQKVWTTMGPWADWGFFLARTDPEDRYGGITYFLIEMDQPGVEVRPLRQLTGDAEFGEVFLEGALARAEHVVGKPGQGWSIANTSLSYERGVYEIECAVRNDRYLGDLIRDTRESGAIERTDVRESLGRLIVENEVVRAAASRILATLEAGGIPEHEASIQKVNWSELERRLGEVAFDLMGPRAQLATRAPYASPGVDWGYRHLFGLAQPIAGGSSEIQRNILARRALGLPSR